MQSLVPKTDTLINKIIIKTALKNETHTSPPAYLKKSFLQYSLPSREKHFSVKLHLHSQHCTHLTCQALSSTLSRKRSRIGLSQPAQWTMALTGRTTPRMKRAQTHKQDQQRGPSIDRLSAFHPPSLIRLELPGQCARRSQSIRCHHGFLPACVKRLSVQNDNKKKGREGQTGWDGDRVLPLPLRWKKPKNTEEKNKSVPYRILGGRKCRFQRRKL